MPQINLLTTETKQKAMPWEILIKTVMVILSVVFVLLLAYYGYLFFGTKKAANSIISTQQDLDAQTKKILSQESRQEVLARQGQLQIVQQIIAEHPYWSKLLPELARVTLTNSSYVGFEANKLGVLKLSVVVASYSDMDKFMQAFDLPKFSEQLTDVKIVGVSKVQTDRGVQVKFDVVLKYNPQFLRVQK